MNFEFLELVRAHDTLAGLLVKDYDDAVAVRTFCSAIEAQPSVRDKYERLPFSTASEQFFLELTRMIGPESMGALDRGYREHRALVEKRRNG